MRRQGLASDLPTMGDMVNEYLVLRAVGQGGVSTVYIVADVQDDQRPRYALKLLHPELAVRPEAHAMLYDEARALDRIDHPNVVRFVSRGTWQGIPYIAVEAVDGRTYASILSASWRSQRLVPHGFHYAVLARVAAGLHAAHSATDSRGRPLHIVHRDVKPNNVLVGYDGRVKLIDLSASRARKRQCRTQAGKVKGTPAYLSPEQVASPREVDHRADVWGLGVMAWEALAGRRLFSTHNFGETIAQVMRAEIPYLSEEAPSVPESIASVVMACLQRDPNRRPFSVRSLALLFADAAAGRGWPADRDLGLELTRMVDSSQSVSHREVSSDNPFADDDTTALYVPVEIEMESA